MTDEYRDVDTELDGQFIDNAIEDAVRGPCVVVVDAGEEIGEFHIGDVLHEDEDMVTVLSNHARLIGVAERALDRQTGSLSHLTVHMTSEDERIIIGPKYSFGGGREGLDHDDNIHGRAIQISTLIQALQEKVNRIYSGSPTVDAQSSPRVGNLGILHEIETSLDESIEGLDGLNARLAEIERRLGA